MPTGKVKFWNVERGFGFIVPDDGGPDVFCHISAVSAEHEALEKGRRVGFEIDIDAKSGKPKATRVQVL